MECVSEHIHYNKIDVRDDDVVKEEDYVNEKFSSYTPSQRDNISMLVTDISKVFYSKTYVQL